MDERIIIINNPIEEDYELIRKKYWNKWVAIYQPNHLLAFERGTVIAFAESSEDFEVRWIMQDYLNENYGGGAVKRFIDEDMEECYVIFRNVR